MSHAGRLDPAQLDTPTLTALRGAVSVPGSTARLSAAFARVRAGSPLVLAAVGASNVANFGGVNGTAQSSFGLSSQDQGIANCCQGCIQPGWLSTFFDYTTRPQALAQALAPCLALVGALVTKSNSRFLKNLLFDFVTKAPPRLTRRAKAWAKAWGLVLHHYGVLSPASFSSPHPTWRARTAPRDARSPAFSRGQGDEPRTSCEDGSN